MQEVISSLAVIALLVVFPLGASGQIQIGTIRGTVSDPSGAILRGARVTLDNPLTGYHAETETGERGEFVFNNVPFARYELKVYAAGFETGGDALVVRSNIPVTAEVRLNLAGATESVTVTARSGLIESSASSTEVEIDQGFIRRSPAATRNRQVQQLIATAPGLMTENNGLLHVRGVDDGILYVIDGVPTHDRIDAVSANAFDPDMVQDLNIITGNIPAEFGGRSGAVVTIQPRSGINQPLTNSISLGAGSLSAGDVAYKVGGGVGNEFGFFASASANRSERFLDPVDPRNFNNHGGAVKLNLRSDYHPTAKDILLFDISVNGSNFSVPNDLEQELAGQHERQQLRDNSQSVSWQRIWSSTTVSNIAYFRRSYRSRLSGSEFDTPIFAEQDREHVRQGLVASLTRSLGGHTFKAGLEAARVAPRESFTFAVTDRQAARRREISPAAMEFDRANPFVFSDRRVRGQFSAYAQDAFTPLSNLNLNVGLRYDHTSLLTSDHQLSPRLGAVYYIASTKTAVRGSFNRLYMPPQVENLLLAESDQARALSPFASTGTRGGAPVRPEKVSAYEVGFAQGVSNLLKLDAAFWWRSFRNFDDPNVFFNTTIIFPNSVAEGWARGLDARLDLLERKGWSGYVSYTNARVLQTGPINGGLFLTDEFKEIGPGTRFVPDHDQRNVAAAGVTYYHRKSGLWASASGRHESGVPLEVNEERLEELRSAPGSDLVNFERGRVKPWTIFNLSAEGELLRDDRVTVNAQFYVENIANKRYAYNFGSPFEGTHFGIPRLWGGRLELTLR
jgi:outer membrane receptor protein involved in Fe transport